MADIKQEGGKWVLISDDGKKREEHNTKEEAVKRLKQWEGHKYRSEGKKPVRSDLLNKLFKLANALDLSGQPLIADEIDTIVRRAAELTPEQEKKIDEYFADPEIQERNRIEAKYLSEDQMLDREPFFEFKYSYKGYPADATGDFRPLERYQTVITNKDEGLPEEIKTDDGTWELMTFKEDEEMVQATYHFVSNKDVERMKAREEFKPEIEKMLAEPDELEVTETPEDVVEVKEHGGGTKLF